MFCKGGVQSRQFTEPEQVTTAQGGVFCQVIPIGAGPFEAAMHSISMGDVTLNLGQVSACMGLLRTASDRALLQLPLEGAESLTLNTVPYRPGMVGTYAGGADLLRVGSRPTSFATLVLPSDAVETLLEPAAESRLLQPGGFALMQASSGLRGIGPSGSSSRRERRPAPYRTSSRPSSRALHCGMPCSRWPTTSSRRSRT